MQNIFLKNKKNKGFAMVEVILAFAIVASSILISMAVMQKALQASYSSLSNIQANFLLEEGAEKARITRDNSWNNIVSLNTTEQIGIFTRTSVASSVNRNSSTGIIGSGSDDAGTKLVTITVSWQENNVSRSKNLKLYLMDIF
jgi:Tfp pilus assembly protein PilV